VVLAGDVNAPGFDILHGLVRAPVAVFEFRGFPALREREKLMSQTDAEHGHATRELRDFPDNARIFRRVAGAVT
jgi:hypothetical protein